MIDAAKLPTIDFVKPGSVKTRASENWVYLPAFNAGMRKAFFDQPKERRDAWLLWLGL
ncbi:regulatory phage cox family protein [Escherichia coli 178900]|nr:regulatory phage cox family protein [Escherichia coli 178900]